MRRGAYTGHRARRQTRRLIHVKCPACGNVERVHELLTRGDCRKCREVYDVHEAHEAWKADEQERLMRLKALMEGNDGNDHPDDSDHG